MIGANLRIPTDLNSDKHLTQQLLTGRDQQATKSALRYHMGLHSSLDLQPNISL